MRILITGGAGYIGSHTLRALLKKKFETVVLDNLSTGYKEFVPYDVPFIEGDILDTDLVMNILQLHKIDSIIHFAALSLVGQDKLMPEKYHRVNVEGTLSIVNAMKKAGTKRIVISSSASVYGNAGADVISEDCPCNPVSVYGRTKVEMEKIVMENSAAGYTWMSLRYFNAAGASINGGLGEKHNPETHLIPLALRAILYNQPLTVFGNDYPTPDGTPIRDYVHVDDLAEAHISAVLSEKNDVINLGTNRGYSVKEIISEIEKVTGRKVPLIAGKRREGDPSKLVASNSKAKKIINWQPEYNLYDIISSVWKWEESQYVRRAQ